MNGNRNNIDNFFRDAAGGYRVAPSAGTWKKIERRFFGGGMALIRGASVALILLGLGVTGYFLLNAGSPVPEINTTSSEEKAISGVMDEKPDPASDKATYTTEIETPAPDPVSSTRPANTSTLNSEPVPSSSEPVAGKEKITNFAAEKKTQPSVIYDRKSLAPMTLGSIEPFQLRWVNDHQIADDTRKANVINMFKDDYARRAKLGMGLHIAPGIIFYDPNPGNNSFMAEATLNYTAGRWTVKAGAGANYLRDKGRYNVYFKSYDSIGYYNEVVSFRFAESLSDSLIIEYEKTTVYDSVPHITLRELNNTYTYIYFPVSVTYRFWNKGRLSAGLSTGLAYSLLVDKNEPTIDWEVSDASLVRIDRVVPARVRSNWLWSAGLNLGFQINNKVKLNIEPTYYLYLNDVYLENQGWTGKKPYSIGIKAGIDFHF